MFDSQIIYRHKNIYMDSVENYLFIYNPLSRKGLTLLNEPSAYLFKLIDNKRTIKDIYQLAQKKDESVRLLSVKKIFDDFLNSEIICLDPLKSMQKYVKKKQKHLSIWFHITNQCNLRCKYCYIWKTPSKITNDIAKQAIKKILVDAKKHNFEKVEIKFSGGECLLELKKLLTLVNLGNKIAKKIGIYIRFVVLTNGTLLSKKTALILKKYNIDVCVSLDGLGKYNDTQRIFKDGSGTFESIEKGIKNLLLHQVSFNVIVTITLKNVKNLSELTQYLLKHKINFVFNFYRENPCVQDDLRVANKILIFYLKKVYKLIFHNPPYHNIMGNLDKINLNNPHLLSCGIGKNYMLIRHDGKITTCQMTIDQPIGSINDEDIIETMRKGNFIRPKRLTVEDKTPCKNCQWRYACCGGCPLLTYNQKGCFTTNSPYCEVYKALIPDILRVEAQRIIKYGFKFKHANLIKV